MPRDPGTGVYTLPLPPTEPRRIPVTGWANTTVEDLAAAMNNIPGTALADGSVGTTQLADNSVTNAKMADNSVNTAELADNSVTNAKMADNSVNTAELVDGAVTNPKTDLYSGLGIRGTGGVGSESSWIGLYNEARSSRWGYFGKGDHSSPDIYVTSDQGNLRLLTPVGAPEVILQQGQLQFPSAQNPSSNANTLDDYEEGTFTPSFSFAGGAGNLSVVYSTRVGAYTKIGNVVHVWLRLITTTFTHTTATGALIITGLPFVSASTNTPTTTIYCTGLNLPAGYIPIGLAVNGASYINLYGVSNTTVSNTSPTSAPTAVNKDIIIGVTYQAA